MLIGLLDAGTLVLAGCDHDQELSDTVVLFDSLSVKLLSLPHGDDVRFTVKPVLFVKLKLYATTVPDVPPFVLAVY
tara:strand:- start:418 stop:645 length:228 start_codon:yes stop_codon:yes gene_type:complete